MSGNTLEPPRPVTVISHPLGLSVTKPPNLHLHLSCPWGCSSHVLGAVTPFTTRAGISVSYFSPPNPARCRSGALAARLRISVSASRGRLDTDPARQLPPCSCATIKPSRPSPVCRAPKSWLRRDILLLQWTSPHDATVSSIQPAFPHACLAMLQRTKHHSQDNGLRQCVHTVIITCFCLSSHFIRLTLLSYPGIDGLHTAVITSGEYMQLCLPYQEVPDIRWVMSRCSSVVQDGTPRPQAPLP